MRRILSTAVLLCLLLALIPSARAANVLISGTCGENASWVLTDDGVMTISGTGTVTEPMDVDTAFDYATKVQTIRIEEGITVIAPRAFSTVHLEEETLILPDSLKIIGDHAFYGNWTLKEVSFGRGLITIESNAFASCGALTSVELPDNLQFLGSGAFSGSGLTEIVVPGSVKAIGVSAFSSCAKLVSATVLDGVQLIDNSAFAQCHRLEQVCLADSIRAFGICVFDGCFSLKTIRLPAQLTAIPWRTFCYCRTLETVIAPGTVQSVAENAFYECSALKRFCFAGTEDMLSTLQVAPLGNDALFSADVLLIPAMPDPVFGFYDLPAPDSWAYPGIAFCLGSGLMNGTGGGYFRPSGTTTRAQLVTILWRMLGEPEASSPAPFTDLTQDWYAKAVAWAAENGITNGTSNTTFSPDAPVTREQMVTIFYRLCKDYLQLDVSPAAALDSFPDSASVSPWAQDAMQWAVAVKLISGVGDGSGQATLQPQGSATRAQIATVMRNFCTAFPSVITPD